MKVISGNKKYLLRKATSQDIECQALVAVSMLPGLIREEKSLFTRILVESRVSAGML
jgi:hypothetical protein